ncbi:MAG: NADH-quinone oxidoreductase subunit N [Pseudomonadota bacterium]
MRSLTVFLGDLFVLAPYGILTAGALLLLLGGARRRSEGSSAAVVVAMISAVGASGTLILLTWMGGGENPFLTADRTGFGFSIALLALLILLIPVLPIRPRRFRTQPGTVLSLLLLSTSGGLLMIQADHLLAFFVGLELLSIPLYILSGLGSDSKKGTEAAFKYFLLGAIASAFFVYGMALLWGSLGTLRISEISRAVSSGTAGSPGLAVFASVLLWIGVAFKVGFAPFQMWLPDVYEGAPATLVSWMAGGVKAAALVVALRLLGTTPIFHTPSWSLVLSAIAVLSMVWGSFGALYQRDAKRMLGYSAIAHAGYVMLALICAAEGSYSEAAISLAFYVLTYGVAGLAVFLVLSLEEEDGRTGVADLAGLALRRPALAFVLAVALFSLAGLPPLGGFIGKFNVFVLAARHGHYALLLTAVATSVISLGYYLRLVVAAYMEKPASATVLSVGWATGATLTVAVLLTFFLGVMPGPVLSFLLGGP